MNILQKAIYDCLPGDLPNAEAVELSKTISSKLFDMLQLPYRQFVDIGDVGMLLQEQKYACAEAYRKQAPEAHYSSVIFNYIASTGDVDVPGEIVTSH